MKPLTNRQMEKVRSFVEYTGICPTCQGEETYNLDGDTHECCCREQLKLQRRYFAANIGSRYHILSLNDFFGGGSAKLKDCVVDYISNFEDNLFWGRGITFNGSDLGTGKTFAATTILKELIKKDYEGYFITFDDLLHLQTAGWEDKDNDEFYTIRDVQILVIDELFDAHEGSKKKELLSDTLERIIRYRVSNRMPTIITTNMTQGQIETAYPRIHSLLSTSQLRYNITGNDVRLNKVKEINDNRVIRGDRKAIV